jgi:hypothetical protein
MNERRKEGRLGKQHTRDDTVLSSQSLLSKGNLANEFVIAVKIKALGLKWGLWGQIVGKHTRKLEKAP